MFPRSPFFYGYGIVDFSFFPSLPRYPALTFTRLFSGVISEFELFTCLSITAPVTNSFDSLSSTRPNSASNQPLPSSSQSPEEIVQRHIRLLKEYNDMKDIGQQMIGLIAENRGIPVRSLYESGEYGVTADD